MKRYTILGPLGEGSMGTVYRAQDTSMDRIVALKILKEQAGGNPTIRQRFIREAQVSAGLSHPNLVTTYDAGEEDGKLYLVMELVEGQPFSALLEKRGLPLTYYLEIVEKVARAIHHAHQHKAVHRDLKPANILVPPSGEPKVTDFGLAHLMQSDSMLTRSGIAVGTPCYMSPEQAEGRNTEITGRTDVYALGAILYEICTGQPPFDGRSVVEIYRKIMTQPVIPPREVKPTTPPDLEQIILKALHKKPQYRYASARHLADDLKRHLSGKAVKARPIAGSRRLLDWTRANPVVASLAAVLIVALSVTGIFLPSLLRGGPAKPPDVAATPSSTPRPTGRAAFDPERLRLLEDVWHGRKPDRDPVKTLKEIQRETSADTPAARAWRGLARIYAGEAAGNEDLEAAVKAAAGDPMPVFLQIRARFAEFAKAAPSPGAAFGPASVSVEPLVPNDAMKLAGGQAVDCLNRAPKDWTAGVTGLRCKAYIEAQALLAGKEYEAAAARFKAAGEESLLRDEAAYLAALALFHGGKWQDSLDTLGPLMERGWPRAFFHGSLACFALAVQHIAKGSPEAMAAFDRAIDIATQGLRFDPGMGLLYTQRGMGLQRKGLLMVQLGQGSVEVYDRSISDCEEALRRMPGNLAALTTLSSTLLSKGELMDALRLDSKATLERGQVEFTRLIAFQPREAMHFYCRGNLSTRLAYYEQSRGRDSTQHLKAAFEDFTASILLNDKFPECFCNRGNILQGFGSRELMKGGDPTPHIDQALRDYESALALNPRLPEALNNRSNAWTLLADLESKSGRSPLALLEKAVEGYEKAIEAKADYVNAILNRGNALMRMGDVKSQMGITPTSDYYKALESFDKGIRIRFTHPNYYVGKAQIYERLKKTAEAVASLQAGLVACAGNAAGEELLRAELRRLGK